MPSVQELLHFRASALSQFLLVATIFGAFSMSGVIALLASHERARLRSALFILLALSSVAFVFATLLAVIILPIMGRDLPDHIAARMLTLYAVDVVAIILGTILMSIALGLVGFMVSKRAGLFTLSATIIAGIVLAACVYMFAQALR
jgi:hypothetical protein